MSCQPHFTALAQYWSGLQDEMVLLSILGNLLINLQPFLTAQSRMFSDVQLENLLEGSEVKSDEQRMTESSGTLLVLKCNSFDCCISYLLDIMYSICSFIICSM